jgi:hypothetical protein
VVERPAALAARDLRLELGAAPCARNTGNREVKVNSVKLLDFSGGVLASQAAGPLVHPGPTRQFTSWSFVSFGPSACTFDLNTKSGVRAAFVYENGSTVVVIPAQK